MSTPQERKELREAVEMWIELAVHKFHAASGAVILGDCSEESVNEIMRLLDQARSDAIGEVEAKHAAELLDTKIDVVRRLVGAYHWSRKAKSQLLDVQAIFMVERELKDIEGTRE